MMQCHNEVANGLSCLSMWNAIENTRSIQINCEYLIVARSQSVGPTTTSEGSPKRQIRSGSAVPAANTTATKQTQKKTPVSTPTIVERRPRPSKSVRFNVKQKKAIN